MHRQMRNRLHTTNKANVKHQHRQGRVLMPAGDHPPLHAGSAWLCTLARCMCVQVVNRQIP